MNKVRCELKLTQEEKDFMIKIGSGNLHTGLRVLISLYKILKGNV